MDGRGWAIGEFGAGVPRVVVDVEDVMANGVAALFVGLYDVNNIGDVLFQAYGFGQTTYGVKRASGEMRHVYATNAFTDDGEFLGRMIDFDLRDDGTVWSLWVNLADEPVMYRFTPNDH